MTGDMDATVCFYHGLLGMPLVGGGGANPMHGRHYLFDAGEFLVGFFWEVTWTPMGAEKGHAGWTFADPDPVPSANEIHEQGRRPD